ncbi:hypothetical protein GE061_000521 [Apolygus lucorum]|uniref:Uncharacterized protein n=1 Tax=Apolygus lucorum TaxID=248454 RepID=A0A8S9Y6G6_APOLU|nr:hypothetical protein GE061_000521 [Apolygus lucorum]
MKIGFVAVTLLLLGILSPPSCSARSVSRRRRHIWAEWSTWSPCTRSCGTGVSSRNRDCLNNKHKPVRKRTAQCEGPRTETKICNRQVRNNRSYD